MMPSEAAIRAVLATLARATADARVPVVLRSRRPDQARDLARWLEAVHGSHRTVIASGTVRGLIEVRLPAQFRWRRAVDEEMMTTLAAIGSAPHLSGMTYDTTQTGAR
jgi:hypothetical protein